MLAKQNVRIAGGDSMVEKWITRIRYIYAAQSVHQKAYIDVRPSLFATWQAHNCHRAVESHTLYPPEADITFVSPPRS